ncbi:transposase [Streptomyces sp. HUAS TT20]|nr:transposase [Streptomyces sp. HUAS 15-9]UXY32257.1 transposase [Streptomyces sp. HUAS 15-9]
MRRHERSDAEWEFVRPLLPSSLRGRKRLDDRRILNGIVWKVRTGTAWWDVPDRYGPWVTLHTSWQRGIAHTIPERADQVRNRLKCGSRGGRPTAFDKHLYK